jgi:hypothetical protein
MASFRYNVELNQQQFALAVAQELKAILDRTISQLIRKIRPSLIAYIENKLRKDPNNTYYSLDIGDLRNDFGFRSGQNAGERVVKAISGSVEFTKLGPTSASLGGVRLQLLKGGIEFLLDKDFGAYDSNGNTVDWLRWLLTAGDTIVVADYQVMKDKGTPLKGSRSGYALMISPKMSKGFRVDPNHSGTIDDNWITRALAATEVDMLKKLQEGLEGLLK